ncbi:hypothetical protein FPZ12_014280 [Amycolatopsis acidicola]|uniref:Uncharacterized protein n=1 Tax=Amycolatopsis acidicola TaxID=2596893 RepID=A0A5N0V5Q4_9PSEU|nr:hypothetical protein [Amycolatopsis acidicola]KAA9161315.1 hypothetical protein FPZ12_014280 [Amycolatopsis acidicola]
MTNARRRNRAGRLSRPEPVRISMPMPEPAGSAAMLAAERELGRWIGSTYLPRNRRLRPKWTGAELQFYRRGLVVTGPHDFQAAFGWDTAKVLQHAREPRYTVFDDSGRGVSIGSSRISRHRREQLGIRHLERCAPFAFDEVWGPRIQQNIAEAQLPIVLAQLHDGETSDFGAIRIDRDGIHGAARWQDIGRVRARNGRVRFLRPNCRHRRALRGIRANEIVSLGLFLAVCAELTR